MITLNAQKIGAALRAKQQRDEAVRRYLADPNVCQCCNKPIPLPDGVKVSTIRKNKFCSRSCSGKFHNIFQRPDIRRERAPLPLCRKCGTNTVVRRANGDPNRWCAGCVELERQRVGSTRKSDTTHAKIRGHSRSVLSRERPVKRCDWCGYDRHAECCHLKPVSSFGPDALLSEINSPDNLRWLCPNCHWELDHGMVAREGFEPST